MKPYLQSTDIIDWQTPAVLACARDLCQTHSEPIETARACFEWVRDCISHSGDHQVDVTTCRASDVLAHRTGWCFAKSHLLAALLRANDIPAGVCYQRLRRDDDHGFTLHGLNAAYLPGIGWYRIDPRGNKPGVDAQFCPPEERLAWSVTSEGEMDFPEIWPDPVPVVVQCLQTFVGWEQVAAHLPDVEVRSTESSAVADAALRWG